METPSEVLIKQLREARLLLLGARKVLGNHKVYGDAQYKNNDIIEICDKVDAYFSETARWNRYCDDSTI